MTSVRQYAQIDDLGFPAYDWGMYIGRVTGTVVATIKHEAFYGRKLLIVDRLTPEGDVTGAYDICVDVAQAGVGDWVLVIDEGNGARQILQREVAPVRAVIVGIVDDVDIEAS
ncbi:MAG TPA: hypothetical protein EYP90_09960 [Chromatiaceae bacterium]|nr:hypothetical protein [Chromatiaceae bacterium]